MAGNKKKVVSIICIFLVIALLATLLISSIGSAFAVTQSQIDGLKGQQSSIAAQKNAIKDKMSGLESDVSTYTEKKVALDKIGRASCRERV